jgi:4-carboxymuconolactone decarboxylase
MTGEIKPRIGNLPREQWTEEARDVFAFWGNPGARENGVDVNPSMVFAQHPKLAIAYYTFGKQVLLDSTLPVRPRELVVLRMAWLLKAEYEWHYHVGYAVSAGMTYEEIAAIKDGAGSPVWDGKDEDRAVLAAVDELIEKGTITDPTWAALARFFDTRQLMDLVFTAGNYVVMTWAINAFGIPLEDHVDRIDFDLRTRSGAPPPASNRPSGPKGQEPQA